MSGEGFLDLDKVFLEITLKDSGNRSIAYPITSVIFVGEGPYVSCFGMDKKVVESFVGSRAQRTVYGREKTKLADIFYELSYIMGRQGGLILLTHPTGGRSFFDICDRDDKKRRKGGHWDEYSPILASRIQNIAVLIEQEGDCEDDECYCKQAL